MSTPSPTSPQPAGYELRFRPLYREGRALCFPCDANGDVCLDLFSDRARQNYLYARAMVGMEFAVPSVNLLVLP